MKTEMAEDGTVYDTTEKGNIFCANCGGSDKFYVNRVNYETHITCVNCDNTVLIHEG